MLGLLGIEVVKFCAQLGTVVFHHEAVGSFVVVLFKFDPLVEVAYIINCHFIVVFECIEKGIGVVLTYVFNAKIVNYQCKDVWLPLVPPQERGDEVLVVTVLGETFFEELLGKAS